MPRRSVASVMGSERPKVGRMVLAFLKSEVSRPADFTIREDGVVRLNPELAWKIVGPAAEDPRRPRAKMTDETEVKTV